MNFSGLGLEANFYVTGGTLRRDAACYVRRQADEDLFQGLINGAYCHVLTSRQMGKSSLMVHTAARLRELGFGVAILDLTAIGFNLTIEQWYGGLLSQIGAQLQLEDELIDFWAQRTMLSPLQAWMRAIRDIVLPHYFDRVIIFVDEIDAVHNLPFSTDEFFAGIRNFYNGRTDDEELEKLTFCLLGVAAPADLIRETRTTPFNIGRRIELTDFTEAEAEVLAQGLSQNPAGRRQALSRVLDWTGGHPYLTQKLCLHLASTPDTISALNVDRACAELFLSHRALERDANLTFVRERLLHSEADPGALLDLYQQIRQGKQVVDDETNPLVSGLRLAGIAKAQPNGALCVRNRIYEHVFDQRWVTANLPDAELRRQRRAYRRGWLRATVIWMIGLLALSSLWLTYQSRSQRDRAVRLEQTNRRLRYAAEMNLVSQAWEAGDATSVLELLTQYLPQAGQEDLRGFEWRYYWRLSHQNSVTILPNDPDLVQGLAYSPDGRWVAVGLHNGNIKLFEVATRREINTLTGHTASAYAVTISPNGRLIASASWDKTVRLWDAISGHQIKTLQGHEDKVYSVAFSPDGQTLASSDNNGVVRLWDTTTGQVRLKLSVAETPVWAVAFSPDGKKIITAGDDAKIFQVKNGTEILALKHATPLTTAAFSPDNRYVITASRDSSAAKLWHATTGKEIKSFSGHTGTLWGVVFSPDGQMLATTGDDSVVKLWNVQTGQELSTFRGHQMLVAALAFSPDGQTLATGSWDKTIRLWPVSAERQADEFTAHDDVIRALAYAPDGRQIATASDDQTINLWDADSHEKLRTLKGHTDKVNCLAYAPDGAMLVTGSDDKTIRLWETKTGQEVRQIKGFPDQVWTVAFSPDGQKIAATGFGKIAKVWAANSSQELFTITGYKDFIFRVIFAPDKNMLVSSGDDDLIKFWNAETGQELQHRNIGKPAGRLLTFSPAGNRLVIEHGRNNLKLFETSSMQELRAFKGHTSRIMAVAFSPDGKRLATASEDETVKLWDVENERALATIKPNAGKIFALAFAPDGGTLAVSGSDHTVKLYRAATDKEVTVIRK